MKLLEKTVMDKPEQWLIKKRREAGLDISELTHEVTAHTDTDITDKIGGGAGGNPGRGAKNRPTT